MGFKEKMMENMMGKMSAEEKKDMMDKMMESFFSTMTKEEKEDMMNNMMPKMMEQMMGGGGQGSGGGMMGMMSSMMGGKGSMMDMMSSMMGNGNGSNKQEKKEDGFNPMDMCQKMMSNMSKNNEIATFATPEVRQMFEEWVQQVDEEILVLVKENNVITPEELAEKLKISKNSAVYFLSRLAQKGKISINISKADG
ncbi:MAG: winged helix-turn-helix domain-containing protein [Bacillota bacterium]|nr:winged helix-turn-helix domain-containing protein [Bacillota bacterium]